MVPWALNCKFTPKWISTATFAVIHPYVMNCSYICICVYIYVCFSHFKLMKDIGLFRWKHWLFPILIFKPKQINVNLLINVQYYLGKWLFQGFFQIIDKFANPRTFVCSIACILRQTFQATVVQFLVIDAPVIEYLNTWTDTPLKMIFR